MKGQVAWIIMGGLSLAEVGLARGIPRVGNEKRMVSPRQVVAIDNAAPRKLDRRQDELAAERDTITETVVQTVTVDNAGGDGLAGASQLVITTTVFEAGPAATVTVNECEQGGLSSLGNVGAPADAGISAAPASLVNANPNGQDPVIISGASSNQGIVIVSLVDTRGPTTTVQVSTTAEALAPIETAIGVAPEITASIGLLPIDTTLPALDDASALPALDDASALPALDDASALPALLTQSIEPLAPLETTEPLLTDSLPALDPIETTAGLLTASLPLLQAPESVETAAPLLTASLAPLEPLPPAADATLESSLQVGLIQSTLPAAAEPAAPEVTAAPAEVQNPAAGADPLTLDQDIDLASQIDLGTLGGV